MDDEPRRKKIKSVGSTYGTLRNKIQKRLHQNYPFLQQSGVRYLADTILQHEFYTVRQDQVVLRMTPLLRHLEGPINDPIERSKRRNVLSHLHRPVPLVRQQDKADFQLLLHAHQYILRQQKAASQSWERLYYLMMLAYKFRYNVYCPDKEWVSAVHDALVLRDAQGNVLEIRPRRVQWNNNILQSHMPADGETKLASSLFMRYLQCIHSTYIHKSSVIRQIVLDPDRLALLSVPEVGRMRMVSKQIKHRHPIQQMVRLLRTPLQIPTHIIRICQLKEVLQHGTVLSPEEYGQVKECFTYGAVDFQLKEGVNVPGLVHALFPPGSRQCIRFFIQTDNVDTNYNNYLEVHIYCRVQMTDTISCTQNNPCVGLFSMRFYSYFMEYMAISLRKQDGLVVDIREGSNCILLYDKEDEDVFLGWDYREAHSYQSVLQKFMKQKQTIVGADPFADKLVHLIQSAITVQTTQKNTPMYRNKISKWISEEDELPGHPVVFLFPTLP